MTTTAYGRKLMHAFADLHRANIEASSREHPHDGKARGGDIWAHKESHHIYLVALGHHRLMRLTRPDERGLMASILEDGKYEYERGELDVWFRDNGYVFVGYLDDFVDYHKLYDAVLTATGDMPTDDGEPGPVIEIYPTITSALDAVFDEPSNVVEE